MSFFLGVPSVMILMRSASRSDSVAVLADGTGWDVLESVVDFLRSDFLFVGFSFDGVIRVRAGRRVQPYLVRFRTSSSSVCGCLGVDGNELGAIGVVGRV